MLFVKFDNHFYFLPLLVKIFAGLLNLLIFFDVFAHDLLHMCCKRLEILLIELHFHLKRKHGLLLHITCSANASKSLRKCSKTTVFSLPAHLKKSWIFFLRANIAKYFRNQTTKHNR